MSIIEDWEDSIQITSIVAVTAFILFNLITFGYLVFKGNVDIYIPLKLIIYIGLGCWMAISSFALYFHNDGFASLIIKIFTFLWGLVSIVYISFFSDLLTLKNIIYLEQNQIIQYPYALSSVIIGIGLYCYIKYTFFD